MRPVRIAFSVIFIALIAALIRCHRGAHRSDRAIGASVALLNGALIPPLIGNLIIVASSWEKVSTVGYYIYFLGMDAVMLALLRFTLDYCRISKARLHSLALIPLGIDVVQYAVNPFTGHCFATEAIDVGGRAYYRLLPYLGQTFHRVVDYGILAAVLGQVLVTIDERDETVAVGVGNEAEFTVLDLLVGRDVKGIVLITVTIHVVGEHV